jgi:hypothetical protein
MLYKKIEEWVRSNPQRFTYKEVADKFGIRINAASGIIGRAGLRDLIIKEGYSRSFTQEKAMKSKQQLGVEARLESQLRAKTKSEKEQDRKYRVLQDELHKKDRALQQALQVMAHQPKVYQVKATRALHSGNGTAVVLASDWHVDELVPKHKVNGLNEYNPEIAKARALKFFELVVRFIRVDRQETHIKNLVLWLGGDFFTSSEMHDASCAFPPVIACMYAQDLLTSGIKYILKEEPDLNIHIVGSVGNHSRLSGSSKPVNQAIEQELSLEWMMYHAMRTQFKEEKRITWQLDNSYHSYVKVYGKTLRFNHGHLGWRYSDGMGGIHGPAWKTISQRWDKQIKADLTCFGHYHTYTPAAWARAYTANGSLIGVSPYSMQFGFEPPMQAYFLVHDKYGIVGQRPLFVGT